MKRLDGFASGLAATATMAVVIAIVTGGGGCELVVSDTLPQYECLPDAHAPCPNDMVCNRNHQCVPPAMACGADGCPKGMQCDINALTCNMPEEADVGPDREPDATMNRRPDSGPNTLEAAANGDALDVEDSTVSEAGDVQSEAPSDTAAPCRGLTCTCSSPSDCDSGICPDSQSVTNAVYLANNSTFFCTQPCCTTADCSASTVCFATGAGGNYCVNPSWIGRTTLGANMGGAACNMDSDCRSGLCAMGACADTCCSTAQQSAQCSVGTVCRFGSFPGKGFDTHYTAWCGPAGGTAAGGSACLADSTCQSNRCETAIVPERCEAVCRSSTECPTGQACLYTGGPASTGDIAAGCVSLGGTGTQGQTCKVNGDCKSDYCDSKTLLCSDVCFADSDCMPGWRCRPEGIHISSGASSSVLICGT